MSARKANTSAYFVIELDITNLAAMGPYRAAVGATIEQYGGRFDRRRHLCGSEPAIVSATQVMALQAGHSNRW
jgi:uncharacterized protein (DUF1330 family)